MGAQMLLIFGAASIAAAGVMLFLAVALGSGALTGTARSLALIEHTVSQAEVGRNELPAVDRLIVPFFSGMKDMAPAAVALRNQSETQPSAGPGGQPCRHDRREAVGL